MNEPESRSFSLSSIQKNEYTNDKYLPLNRQFALLICHGTPYLVDIPQMQEQLALKRVTEEDVYIAKRPLLVPVSFAISAAQYTHIESSKDILLMLGVEIDLLSETTLIVRTIPTCLPKLNLQEFIEIFKALTSPANRATLAALLVRCQSVDALLLDDEEQEEMIGCLAENLAQEKGLLPWCVPLDESVCRKMLYG